MTENIQTLEPQKIPNVNVCKCEHSNLAQNKLRSIPAAIHVNAFRQEPEVYFPLKV